MAIASTRQLKLKTCQWCKGEYTPQRRMQAVCGLPCAIDQSRHKQHIAEQKKADRAHRERKAAAQPKAFHVKQAQTEFNQMREQLKDAKRAKQEAEDLLQAKIGELTAQQQRELAGK